MRVRWCGPARWAWQWSARSGRLATRRPPPARFAPHPLDGADRGLVLGERDGKDVLAVRLRHEKEEGEGGGVERREQARPPGLADRARRQSRVEAGGVRRRDREVLLPPPLEAPAVGGDHRWIGLEPHPSPP